MEIIVVDDGSTDQTAEVALRYGVQVLRQENRGPAATRNAGAQQARGDIIVFTDADCAPTPDWLATLTQPCENPDVVGVKGTYRTRQAQLVARFVQQEYQDKYDRMARRETIDFIDTYSAAYRRSVFLENGGFETAFPVPSVEDQELSFRLAKKGYRLLFAPGAAVYHTHDHSLLEYVRRKFWIGYWKAFLLRWHPEKALGDSHTPAWQRLQLLLMGLSLAAAPGMLIDVRLGWISLALLAAFVSVALPFLLKVARRDWPVLLVVPILLVARALALGIGLVAGSIGLHWRSSPRRAVMAWPNRVLKRGVDIMLSAVGLILSLPILLVAAILTKLDSPGPVFFIQTRVGDNGKLFQMIKLRTMVQDAETFFEQVAVANPLKGPAVKLPNDPRVTCVGRFLRRWSLDELPQLWNILCGDMSLVGPRPEEPWVVAQYTDWHRQRLAVKPGLTGPMQVNGRGDLSLDERVQLELDYIQHYSLWRDLEIILRSIPAVISGRGAY